ncbi:hypothetical protein ASE66_12545 [Bosea sp. Root483D1]|uniref:hypothetical protein n=1 Tax=Bosea sp. Root483D1 TaxID=1736544 RepID=UPI00070FCDD6|nr:hypothetical protein [Bosea sp. Root483D1]KRE15668.1 hypothetical protein ASE66_12545 [Bosea sp. Root483D1]
MSHIRVVDPDNIPETVVAGPFNCSVTGEFATLTFTHGRPVAEKMLSGSTAQLSIEAVVRARLVMPVEGLRNLLDSLDQLLMARLMEDASPGAKGGH